MALLQSTLIQRVRDLLGDNPWQTTATGTATGVVSVADGTRWDEGAILEWQDSGEQDWVQSVSSNDLTCSRGINGTTAVTHSGSVVVYRDPVWTYKKIVDSIELTVAGVWPYIYKKKTLSLTYDSTTTIYNLASDVMGIIQVSQPTTTGRAYIYGSGSSPFDFNLPTSTVTSTVGMAFPNGWARTDQQIQVDYAAKLTTTQTTVGTYADLFDGILAETIALGAAARLAMLSEIPRVTQEDIMMGDSSVQPGARARAGQFIQELFLDKRRQYQQELMRTIPLRPNEQANPLLFGRIGAWTGNTTSPPWG